MYDVQAKQELIAACGQPSISMARLARDCDINANLLDTWVRKHERSAAALTSLVAAEVKVAELAFVPVRIEAPAQAGVQLQARLPTGVVVDLTSCDLAQACARI